LVAEIAAVDFCPDGTSTSGNRQGKFIILSTKAAFSSMENN
jgi:hypothetical protein